jgi:prepilin-type processing-associated H-X9-DG protein
MNYAGPGFILNSRTAPLPPRIRRGGLLRPPPDGGRVAAGLGAARLQGYCGPGRQPGLSCSPNNPKAGISAATTGPPSAWAPPGRRRAATEHDPYQIVTGERQKWAASTYGLHGKRFNYLFHDGHVAIHRITETVGTGTTNAPRGMWTMKAGD